MAGKLVPLGHSPGGGFAASAARAEKAAAPQREAAAPPQTRRAANGQRTAAVRTGDGRPLVLRGPAGLSAPARLTERIDPADNAPARVARLRPQPVRFGANPNPFVKAQGAGAMAAKMGGGA